MLAGVMPCRLQLCSTNPSKRGEIPESGEIAAVSGEQADGEASGWEAHAGG